MTLCRYVHLIIGPDRDVEKSPFAQIEFFAYICGLKKKKTI